MTGNEVNQILVRLAVIETKVEGVAEDKRRLTRLEIMAAIAIGMGLANGLPQLAALFQ